MNTLESMQSRLTVKQSTINHENYGIYIFLAREISAHVSLQIIFTRIENVVIDIAIMQL